MYKCRIHLTSGTAAGKSFKTSFKVLDNRVWLWRLNTEQWTPLLAHEQIESLLVLTTGSQTPPLAIVGVQYNGVRPVWLTGPFSEAEVVGFALRQVA